MHINYKQLTASDVQILRELLFLFGAVFSEPHTYCDQQPSDEYLEKFIANTDHIVLVAHDERGKVVGGLVAYQLEKFEQTRKEIFVYDLAVHNTQRRQGIGTALLQEIVKIAKQRAAYLVFVQAELDDEQATSFYRTLAGKELKASHFEIVTSDDNK